MKKLSFLITLAITVQLQSGIFNQENINKSAGHIGMAAAGTAGVFGTIKTADRIAEEHLKAIIRHTITGSGDLQKFIKQTNRFPYIIGAGAALVAGTVAYFSVKLVARFAPKKTELTK